MTEDERLAEIAVLKRRLAELEAAPPAQTPPPVAAAPVVAKGAKPAADATPAVMALVLMVLLAVGVAMLLSGRGPEPGAGSAVETAAAPADAAAAAAAVAMAAETPAPPLATWRYDEEKDEMRDSVVRTGCVTASDVVRLSAPYETQSPVLCVRKHPRFGTDAYVYLPLGGQFVCTSYSGCTVKIRFDKGAVQSFSANTASDGSSDVLFVSNAQRFIAALKNSEIMRLEAEFYTNGVQQMTFDAAGFEPARVGLGAGT